MRHIDFGGDTAHLSSIVRAPTRMEIQKLFFDIGGFLSGKLGKFRHAAHPIKAMAHAANFVWSHPLLIDHAGMRRHHQPIHNITQPCLNP
jgi:hypothetical protein